MTVPVFLNFFFSFFMLNLWYPSKKASSNRALDKLMKMWTIFAKIIMHFTKYLYTTHIIDQRRTFTNKRKIQLNWNDDDDDTEIEWDWRKWISRAIVITTSQHAPINVLQLRVSAIRRILYAIAVMKTTVSRHKTKNCTLYAACVCSCVVVVCWEKKALS